MMVAIKFMVAGSWVACNTQSGISACPQVGGGGQNDSQLSVIKEQRLRRKLEAERIRGRKRGEKSCRALVWVLGVIW